MKKTSVCCKINGTGTLFCPWKYEDSACSGGSCSLGSPQLVFSSNDGIKENYILMQNSAPSSFSCLYSMSQGPIEDLISKGRG